MSACQRLALCPNSFTHGLKDASGKYLREVVRLGTLLMERLISGCENV